MQLKNWGRGVTMGQRIGLSFCDELKIRRFMSSDENTKKAIYFCLLPLSQMLFNGRVQKKIS